MPRVSKKARLIEFIEQDILAQVVLCDNLEEVDRIIDEGIENLSVIHPLRYSLAPLMVPKSEEWYFRILSAYDDRRFKRYIRVSRQDFGRILFYIQDHPVFQVARARQTPVDKQLAISLYKFGTYGTGASVGNVAALFGVGDGGTIMRFMTRVITALVDLAKEWIVWPSPEERALIERDMEENLPKCIGYIDGSHIDLEEAPNSDPESYFDRKQNYSIQLQAICDNSRKIRHIHVGFPGSTHDARVYNNSEIGKSPERFLSNGQWVAGDSAYPISPYMLTPFRKNATFSTDVKRKKFNKFFSGYRVRVECCFGILKETFGSLKQLRVQVNDQNGHKLACEWIIACCVLYNMISDSLVFEDFDPPDEDDEGRGNENRNPNQNAGEQR